MGGLSNLQFCNLQIFIYLRLTNVRTMAEALNTNRKEQIIATAARLFKKDGYAATSMRDIAAALEIEAASLYHHIKSKEEILESICFDMADKFLNGMREV